MIITLTWCVLRLYFPLDVMSHSVFITFDLMSVRLLFPFHVMFHSAFSTLFPIRCYVLWTVCPFEFFAVDLLSHSTFCRSTFIPISVFFISTFLSVNRFVDINIFETEYVSFLYVLRILSACFAWKVCAV
jgi:hypothetical protein